MILSRGKMTSIELTRVPRLELTEHSDATGTLSFESNAANHWGGMNGFSWWTPALDPTAKFIRIADAQTVYRTIRDRARTIA
jgi:hypothetical protein